MSDVSAQTAEQVCAKCGARQPRKLDECWLCGVALPTDGQEDSTADSLPTAPERFSFSLSTLLLLMTLASVCFGLLAEAPGLGVPMCVLLVPVLVRTAMVVRRREAVGRPVSRVEKISLMFSSFGVATVLAIVVSAAAFTGFCGVCLVVFSAKEGGTDAALLFLWGLGMCAVAALAVWGSIKVMKWIRRRYRRDTSRQAEGFNAEGAEKE